MTDPDFLVNYKALTSWWIAATTDRAIFRAAAPEDRSTLKINVAKNGSYAARAHLLAWARRAAESMLSCVPLGAGPNPLTRTQFSTAITQLLDQLQDKAELSRTKLAAQRALGWASLPLTLRASATRPPVKPQKTPLSWLGWKAGPLPYPPRM